jgi:CBS domain-containing protein
MKVKDIMSQPPCTCSLNASVSDAGALMHEHRCGVLPVLSLNGMLVGMVTDRDLCLATAARRRSATHVTVHEAMTTRLATCRPDDDLKQALETMGASGVRRLPVVDDRGHLEGLLSIDDVVCAGVEQRGVTDADIVETLRKIYLRRVLHGGMQVAELQ